MHKQFENHENQDLVEQLLTTKAISASLFATMQELHDNIIRLKTDSPTPSSRNDRLTTTLTPGRLDAFIDFTRFRAQPACQLADHSSVVAERCRWRRQVVPQPVHLFDARRQNQETVQPAARRAVPLRVVVDGHRRQAERARHAGRRHWSSTTKHSSLEARMDSILVDVQLKPMCQFMGFNVQADLKSTGTFTIGWGSPSAEH